MVKFVCDRCNQVMEAADRSHVSYFYAGDCSVDLCKECFKEFLNWLNTKPFCINTKEQEKIDRMEERILNVELTLGKISNELWRIKRNEYKI